MDNIELWMGDCLDLMGNIPDKSVDVILCDLPYGTTKNKWDVIIPFDKLWNQYNRIIKNGGGVILFAGEPFSTKLRMSNIENYRHEWYWNKNNSAGFATAKIRPFSIIENIIVFGNNKVNYYPIKETRGKIRKKGGYGSSENYEIEPSISFNNEYYPKNLLNFGNASQVGKVHPTQKPIALLEYLIKTYTLENELVLDNTMGSGSTGVAAKNLNRRFIGIEKDEKYFEIAKKRILGDNNT